MMNIDQINKRIKQRPPFQMIERVLELNQNESAVGLKNVSINEPYFMGHFPDAPIMPGVLIIESCAQLCSLVFDTDASDPNIIYVLLKVDTFKFVKPVIPGDQLIITVNKTKEMGPLTYFDAKVMAGNELKAKGSLAFTKMEKSKIYE